jgi:hypothetical protein
MKILQAILLLVLLATSRRFRDRWRESAEYLAAANDEIEASFRRAEAVDNGGRPRLRRVF